MGLVFKYGSEKDVIPILSPDQRRGPRVLDHQQDPRDPRQGRQHQAQDRRHHRQGRDQALGREPRPVAGGQPSIQDVITAHFPFYKIVDVDLKGGETGHRRQPRRPHHHAARQGLHREGAPPHRRVPHEGQEPRGLRRRVNVKPNDATMKATLSAHGLDKLLDGYGVEMKKDVVLDFGRSFRVTMITQGGLASVRFPMVIDVINDPRFTGDEQLLDTSFAAFFRMDQVIFPFASSLVLHKDKQPGATNMAVVARSSPHSIRKTDDTVDLAPFQSWRPKGQWEQFNLAADVEGRLKTAFPAGDKQGVDAVAEVPEGKQARIFVVASSAVHREPLRPRRQRPGHEPVRRHDAAGRRREAAPDRRPLRRPLARRRADPLRHPHDEEHARLAQRRRGPPGRVGQDPQRAGPRPTATSRRPSSTRTRRTRI